MCAIFIVDQRPYPIADETYKSHEYCLDYSIDYCDGKPSPTIKAVIADPELKGQVATSIFGTNKEDSPFSLLMKRVGYPISILFLMLTLVIFIIVRDLRQARTATSSLISFRNAIPEAILPIGAQG